MHASSPRGHRLRRAADLALRGGVPVAVFAIVLAVFMGEQMRIDHELQVIAPKAAVPGATVPVRALVFDRLEMPDGPRLASMPVEVRLRDGEERIRAHARLAPSVAGGAEGVLVLPEGLHGRLHLQAIALSDGDPVASVWTSLDVRRDAPAVPVLGRLAGALQQLELLPIQGQSPPSPFDVRVVGGACVPEQRCDLLVHVGAPAAAIHAEAAPAVTPEHTSAEETSGLVRIPLVIHGPEANVNLVATRGGEEVGRRTVQLPVALATPALELEPRVVAEGESPELSVHVLGDRPGVMVEAYQDGRWARTGSFAPSDDPIPLPFALTPGRWRLEVHTDPFASDRSASRVLVVRAPGQTVDAAADAAIASLGGAPAGDRALRLAWAAASVEDAVHSLPQAVSGRAADESRLASRREHLRVAAIVALLLGLVLAAMVFLRRGIEAALEAQRIMDETGDPELASRRHRRRTLLSALVLVATVLLAFLGAATLIVARAHLLE